jgi:uncharacterized protein YjbI with pentapeptide repeats
LIHYLTSKPPSPPIPPDVPEKLVHVATAPSELRDSDLTETLLDGLDLSGRHAPGVRIVESRLDHVDLSGAKLGGAIVRDVVAVGGSWANADAESATLNRVEMRDVRLTGAIFSGASITDVIFVNCRVDLASFRFSELSRVRFERCRVEEADFYEAKLTSVLFTECNLTKITLAGATFARSELRGCDLAAVANPERLRGVRMPWPDVVQAADVLAAGVGVEIIEWSEKEASAVE